METGVTTRRILGGFSSIGFLSEGNRPSSRMTFVASTVARGRLHRGLNSTGIVGVVGMAGC